MLHSDYHNGPEAQEQLADFFSKTKKTASHAATYEISIISGAPDQAMTVFSASTAFINNNPGSSFGFINCDVKQTRNEGAILSLSNGKAAIYYNNESAPRR
jgi:hypothetical protein